MHKFLLAILAAGSMVQTAHAEEITFQGEELNDQAVYSAEMSHLDVEVMRRGPGFGPRPGPGRPGHGGPRRPDPYPYPNPGHGGPRPPHNPHPGPPGPRPPSYPPPYYRTEYVQCSSFGYRTNECYVGNYRLQSIRLFRQDSYESCIYGRTYGIYGDRVWVSHGCRATFAVERY